MLAQAAGGADTAPEVQALVTTANTALAKIEAYNNGDGTTPAALTAADYAAAVQHFRPLSRTRRLLRALWAFLVAPRPYL